MDVYPLDRGRGFAVQAVLTSIGKKRAFDLSGTACNFEMLACSMLFLASVILARSH